MVLVSALLAGMGVEAQGTAGKRPVLVVNEDNSHFFGSRAPEAMDLAGLQQFVDQYAGSAVTHLFLCPNAMRANFVNSARDAIWAPVNGVAPTGRWPLNAKLLHEKGLDAYTVWIARAREKGISPWISMRMNDVHGVPELSNYMHDTFWREHPEFWRVPNNKGGAWTDRALNYAHPEVRAYEMAFVKVLLERYDPDGLELDWMRFGRHLTPGREREEGELLTAFVREVRELTNEWGKKRGHPIRLAARVPAHPDAAVGLGMDGVAWAKEGLVDWLVPCPFWSSTDFDIPVELWRERLGEAVAKVSITPGVEHNARPWPGGQAVANDLALLAGFAASGWSRGADGMYLFNWMDCGTRPVPASAYAKLLAEGLGADTVAAVSRRHASCYRDTVPPGFPNGAQLPISDKGSCRIHIGPRPEKGKAWVVVGLAGTNTPPPKVTVNGSAAGAAEKWPKLAEFTADSKQALRFPVPLAVLKDGYNTVGIHAAAAKVVWLELRIEP